MIITRDDAAVIAAALEDMHAQLEDMHAHFSQMQTAGMMVGGKEDVFKLLAEKKEQVGALRDEFMRLAGDNAVNDKTPVATLEQLEVE